MVIGHYTPRLWEHGGVASYIRRLGRIQQAAGHEVLFFDLAAAVAPQQRCPKTIYCHSVAEVAAAAHRHGAQVLHVHRDFPTELAPPIPLVRTIHDHTPYCPSGGRYLRRSDSPCHRAYSLGGCLKGHLVDRCGSLRPKPLLTNFARTWNERHRLRKITTIVSSSFVRNQMLREGYDPDRLMYVPKPAPEPVERIAPPPPSPQFLFLGRIVPHKGLAWLLESLAALERPARLDIAGEGVEAEAMKALVARLHLQDRVVFHGWVDRSVTERLLDRATALVIPSRWHEPFGQVSLEAMARGRAVIASDTGALPEIILHRQTGLIVPARAREALTAAMRQLADHPQCAAEMGLAGWHRVQEHYSMENHLNRILDLYRQCSAEAPAHAV